MSCELSAELKKMGSKLKVKLEAAYRDPNKISKVQFKFPKKVWADLANKEGELLPSCCANVSAMRDEFVEAMRDDGWMDVESMQHLVINMAGHDYSEDHPATKVKSVWDALEGHLELRKPSSDDPTEVDGVISRVNLSAVWEFCSKYGFRFSDWGKSLHDQATYNKAIYDVFPTIHTLYEKIKNTGFEPVEGFALVRSANNEIYDLRIGLAIFPTQEEAYEVAKGLLKNDALKPEDIIVMPVRVSVEKGIEYLTEVTNSFKLDKDEGEIDKKYRSDLFYKINQLRTENENSFKNDKVEIILLETIRKIQELKVGSEQDEDSEDSGF